MNLQSDQLFQAVKPLYGIPESGLHWFLTYQQHHIKNINMTATKSDACVLYKRGENSPEGLCILQVDDSYGHGSKIFLE